MSSPNDSVIKTDVVIIGAGPTGLSLACQLTRYGVDFVMIEKNKGVTPYSKAIGVHARTIEIYEQLSLAQPAIEQGTIAGAVRLLVGGTFCVSEPINDEAATFANGGTIAFKCNSAKQVREFHDTAVAHGGTSIEDAPGLRNSTLGSMHLACMRDPDGNKG